MIRPTHVSDGLPPAIIRLSALAPLDPAALSALGDAMAEARVVLVSRSLPPCFSVMPMPISSPRF